MFSTLTLKCKIYFILSFLNYFNKIFFKFKLKKN